METLRRITYDLVDKSRSVTESNDLYDLDEGRGAEHPRLTRIKLPHQQHPFFRELLRNSRITEVLTDSPDTMLRSGKLNTKAPGRGAAVEWRQDGVLSAHR